MTYCGNKTTSTCQCEERRASND